MYIKDGICYASSRTEPTVITAARFLYAGIILVTFALGERRLFDTTLLKGEVFEPLKDEEVLKNMSVEGGFISWLGGTIDIAPETVYHDSYPYEG